MTATIIFGEVDEHGRMTGFSCDAEAGRFGENLEEGQEVELPDGGTAVIEEVYQHIQTRQWASNFVAVRLSVESE